MIGAVEDTGVEARVVASWPLRYAEGADPLQDRPPHVRAASAVGWLGDRLVIAQDDAAFFAIVDPGTLRVEAVPLPAGPGGKRQFDDLRGNKALKMDLEAGLTLTLDGEPHFVALGSGSTPLRSRVALLPATTLAPRVVDAAPLYERLRAITAFAGSELNVEGAVALPGVVRLFNRGNGAPAGDTRPVDGTIDLPLDEFARFLRAPAGEPPRALDPVAYDLGAIDGVRLTFTDACVDAEARVWFVAAAEASPDATRDGPVTGSAIGIFREGAAARYAVLRGADGRRFPGKVEGIAPSRERADEFWLVVDEDHPSVPSVLCRVRVAGVWG